MVDLAVHHGQRDAQLSSVVRHHDDLVGVGDRGDKTVKGDDKVGDDEERGAEEAAQLGPGPQVVEELDSGDGPPHHEEDEAGVEGSDEDHDALKARQQEEVDEGGQAHTHQAPPRLERAEAKGQRVAQLGPGEHAHPRQEVALVLPHQEGVSQGAEEEPDEDLSGVSVGLGEVHAVQQNEDHEGDDGQTFEDAVDQRVQFGLLRKEHKENGDRLKERHQLWPHGLQLKQKTEEYKIKGEPFSQACLMAIRLVLITDSCTLTFLSLSPSDPLQIFK